MNSCPLPVETRPAAADVQFLEDQINAWLEENKQVKIIDRKMSATGVYCTVVIFYIKLDPNRLKSAAQA